MTVIVVGIEITVESKLFQLVDACDLPGRLPTALQCGKQHRRQNRDDRNYNEKLYERK